MASLEQIPTQERTEFDAIRDIDALPGPGGLSTLDRIRARYRAAQKAPARSHVDLAVPGQEDLGLGVRYRALTPEELAEQRVGDLNGDASALLTACECIVLRNGARWAPLLDEHGVPLRFEHALSETLGLGVPSTGEALDVLRAVFGMVPQPALGIGDHATKLVRWMSRPVVVEDEAAVLGESSASPT